MPNVPDEDNRCRDSEVENKTDNPENHPDASYDQSGEFGIGHMEGGQIKDNAQVASKIDNTETQMNFEAAVNTAVGKVCGDLNIFQAPPKPPEGIPQNLPRTGAKLFVGRDEAMQTLHEQLQATERVAITSITGMGGIGKTELALQYAIQYREECYPGGVCWLQVRGVDVGIQVINFARSQLDVNPPEDWDLYTQVDYCWRHWHSGEALVIFDDVTDYEEIEAFLPPGEGRFKVLMTTRHQWLGQSFQQLELEVLEEAAALELLVSFVGQERIQRELEEAKALCAFLGFLPLGLELVGRYLQRKRDLSLAKTRQRLGLEHKSLKPFSKDMTAERGVAAAFELSWQELDEKARELGRLLSLFAPAAIPWSLVEGCMPEVDEEDLEDLRDGLVNLSLLQRMVEGCYQLHQLIREFFRSKLPESSSVEKMKRSICRAIAGVAEKIPQRLTRQEILVIKLLLIPHLTEVATNLSDWLTDDDLIRPFVGLGNFYQGQGLYDRAEPWLEQCLEIAQSRLGSAHPSVAASLNNLALLYRSQGRYAEAEPPLLKAAKMTKQLLGSAHPDVAASLNNLAELYRSQGRYAEAEPLYVEALEMRKQLLGSAYPDVAQSLNNLALLYHSQGRYAEAEPPLLKAVKMTKQLLGSAHPDVAASLNNLAELYRSQGRYAEAEPLYAEALEMYKQLLGSAHPDVAASLNNLAELYRSQGRYAEAEPLLLKALEMRKQLLGSAHPDVATSLNNLAELYHSQGRYAEAEPLLLKALEMYKQLLGSAHPNIATSLNNLAGFYDSQGRYAEAEPLYAEALEMRKQLLGSAHPDVATSLNNLAALYDSQGRYAEAEPLYLQALGISIRQLGQEHPNTRRGLENYLIFLQQVKCENRQWELSDERSLQIILEMDGNTQE